MERSSHKVHSYEISKSLYILFKCYSQSFQYVGQTPRSRSQGQICWHSRDGLISRNTDVKCKSFSANHTKDTAKVKVFCKSAKHKGKDQKVKLVGTHPGLATKNTHVKYQNSNAHHSKDIAKDKVFSK